MSEEESGVGIIAISLSPDTQSEEAQNEVKRLLRHLDELQRKEEGTDEPSTTLCVLFDYYSKTPEMRALAQMKIREAKLGYGVDTHAHIIYRITASDLQNKEMTLGQTDYENIIGYQFYYDDGNAYNPIIVIGERYVIKEFRKNGFFRGVLSNLMASLEKRVPFFKTEILTYEEAHNGDMKLFVSLGFVFVRPHLSEDITVKEARNLSCQLIRRLEEEKDVSVKELVDAFPQLIDKKYVQFLMVHIPDACQVCKKKKKEDDAPLDICSRCLSVFYCSSTCQSKAWPIHKLVCKSNLSRI